IQDSGEPGIESVAVELAGTDNAGAAVNLSQNTSASGAYNFTELRPGTYTATFTALPGYEVTVQNAGSNDARDSDINPTNGQAHAVTLTSGDTDNTIDAGYYRPASVGDFLWHDQDGNGVQDVGEPGIAGVSVSLYTSTGSQVGSAATTAGDGSYSFSDLAPGSYYMQFAIPGGYVRTHANEGSDDKDSDANESTGLSHTFVLTSNETDLTVDAGFYQTATLGDFVWLDGNYDGVQNDAGVVSGVSISLTGTNNVGESVNHSTSASSGNYEFTGLAPGNYNLSFSLPAGQLFTTQNQGSDATDSDVNPSTGEITNISLASGTVDNSQDVGYVESATVEGVYWHDTDADGIRENGETAIVGSTVRLRRTSDNSEAGTTTTAGDGSYIFTDVFPGDYYLEFVAVSANGAFSPQDQGSDDSIDSDTNPVNGQTASLLLMPGTTTSNVDAGFYNYAEVGNFVWEDLDADGSQDSGEPGINGVTVDLLDASGAPTGQTTTTSSAGAYLFEDVVPGTYRIGFSTPTGYEVSPYQTTTSGLDSDLDSATGYSAAFTLISDEENLTLDAGFYRNAAIGDFVWEDMDGDGVQDIGESGIENIDVRLLNA
ncbi:hypothetical protein KAH55_06885, partial [bacterium]|nr:hypothetical protein [bacterium]